MNYNKNKRKTTIHSALSAKGAILMYYGDKREAKVNIMAELVNRGWEVFGYTPDRSDSMTDYYAPSHWNGIATKNGFVLVIDNHGTYYSGYEVKEHNYNKNAYKATARIEKLEAMMHDAASTDNEKDACKVLINKEKEKQGIKPSYTVKEVYPTFTQGNPKSCSWHIEFEGQVVGQGTGVFACHESNDHQEANRIKRDKKINALVDRIESCMKSAEAFETKIVKVPVTVTKPVEIERKEIKQGDIIKLPTFNSFWIVEEVSEKAVFIIRLGKTYKQLTKNQNNYYRYSLTSITQSIAKGNIKLFEIKEVTEYQEKTVTTKTKRTQKASDAVQLESNEVVKEQPEQATEAAQAKTVTNDTATEDQATKRQLWALHCATKLNTTNLIINKEKASELITKSKAGNNIIDEVKAMLNGEPKKENQENAQETETTHNSKQEKEQDQTQYIEKIDKQIDSAQKKLDSLSGDHLTNTWKRQQEEASREMKRELLRYEIALLDYLKDKASNNSMTKLEQTLLVGAFRDQLHNYSISRNSFIYPEIDTRYDLNGWYNSEVPKKQKRLHKAGLYNISQLTATVEEYKAIKNEIKKPVNPIMQKIKKLESEVKFRKIAGYFPTPKNIIEQMLNHADIRDGEKILEPSAGNGNILDSITAHIQTNGITATIEAVEWNHSLREILELKNYKLVSNDFIEYAKYNYYDKIIMNPPFEKNQDIQHVQHAYKCLNNNGRLVAIMSPHFTFANDSASVNFREWLEGRGYYEKLPEGAFKDSGTNVNTIMVIIDKLEETTAEAI